MLICLGIENVVMRDFQDRMSELLAFGATIMIMVYIFCLYSSLKRVISKWVHHKYLRL